MTARKISLEKITGEIAKLSELRRSCSDIDDYCSYTIQLRHYKAMYERLKRMKTFDEIRRENDRQVI